MKIATAFGVSIRSRSIRAYERLDASFYSTDSILASEKIALLEASGVTVRTIGVLGTAFMPPRTALVRAAANEKALPYLRPYDVFDYLPTAADRISAPRNSNVESFQIEAGMILQTRSGRNLGPCTIADAELARFALSDDMVRITIDDEDERLLVLAFLKTALGQALIRRGRSGSVIDHLTVADVEAVPVPSFAADVTARVCSRVRDAVERRQRGRSELNAVLDEMKFRYPDTVASGWTWWPMQARQCGDRLDAGHHHPAVRRGRQQLDGSGGMRLGTLAEAVLPVRYKRYYVEKGHGRPIVSGRQLLQPEPINLRHVSDRSFRNPQEYEIHTGHVVFGAVGRSEGRQAWPALVTSDRDGWLASNDVMRLRPINGISPGALWLAVATPQVQAQIKALSFGSVVDHMNPWDVEDVIVPQVDQQLGERTERAWADLAASTSLIREGVADLEQALEDMANI